MTDELWKDIEGYEGHYQISNFGNIKSFYKRNKLGFVSPYINSCGYYALSLCLEGVRKCFLVHRLIALHFIEKVEGMPEVNHKDRNKLNNNVSNLEWADDFIQNNNRDCVINAKQYAICFEKDRERPSKWRVRWRENGKGRDKFFKTKEEATEWAEKEMPKKSLDKLYKSRVRK
jgi:hypothetical protein